MTAKKVCHTEWEGAPQQQTNSHGILGRESKRGGISPPHGAATFFFAHPPPLSGLCTTRTATTPWWVLGRRRPPRRCQRPPDGVKSTESSLKVASFEDESAFFSASWNQVNVLPILIVASYIGPMPPFPSHFESLGRSPSSSSSAMPPRMDLFFALLLLCPSMKSGLREITVITPLQFRQAKIWRRKRRDCE